MKRFEEFSKQNNDANAYLIKPFQRLTKYKLLIIPIVKFTAPQHPDYQNLEAAQTAFANTVDKVNHLKDRIMMNKKIQDLDREFSTDKFPILDKNRRLLFEE